MVPGSLDPHDMMQRRRCNDGDATDEPRVVPSVDVQTTGVMGGRGVKYAGLLEKAAPRFFALQQ